MASFVLTDAKIWVAQYDLSGDMNAVALEEAVDPKDATTFGAGTRIHKGGLADVRLSAEGLFNADLTDAVVPSLIGNTNSLVPLSVAAQGATEGNVAHIFPASLAEYQFGAPVGEMLAFSLQAAAVRTIPGSGTRARLARGQILLSTQKTATGSGTAFQLGAVGATQKLYVAMHVLAQSGGTPTLRVQSDDNGGFASATTRATSGSIADWLVVNGPITDDWWRADWTFSGTNFTAIVIAAIR